MSDKETPTGIQVNEVIKLDFPIKVNGVLTDQLVMRRFTVKDWRAAGRLAGNDDEEREIRLFSMLTDCAVNDLEGLDFADYGKLQAAFQRVSSNPFKNKSSAE